MGCGASNEEENPPPPPRPMNQEEYRAERMRVRAAIRERIMKPLLDFRFATSEKEWRRMPGTPQVDDRAEMSLHEQYIQPHLQTDDDLRAAIREMSFSTGSRPQSVKSGKSGKSDGHKTHASAGAVSALSHPSASSWNSKPQSSHRSNETEEGGEVKSERSGSASGGHGGANQQSPSNQSLISTSTGGRITKGEVFAARHSIMNRDLHTTGVKIIEHRQSLAQFSNVSEENITSALAGITMSKRHTMTTEDYGAVEAVPTAVVESRIEGDRNLEAKLGQLQEERRIEEEVQREIRRGSVATLGAASRRSLFHSGGSGAFPPSVHGSPGGLQPGMDRSSHASGVLPAPSQAGGAQEVWDEEMDAEDNETLMMIMGDAQSQAPDTAFGMSKTGFGASPGTGEGAKGNHLKAPSEFDGSSTDLNSNHHHSPMNGSNSGAGGRLDGSEKSPNSLTHALKGDGGLPGAVPDEGRSPMKPEGKYLQNTAEAHIHHSAQA